MDLTSFRRKFQKTLHVMASRRIGLELLSQLGESAEERSEENAKKVGLLQKQAGKRAKPFFSNLVCDPVS